MALTALPAFVKTGTVRGAQLVVGIDTAADVDTRPDGSFPAGASLVFTPSVDVLQFPLEHTTVYPQVVPAVVGDSGDPETTDGDVLELVANLGQPENDQAWWWTVTVKIGRKALPAFRFNVTADQDNFLTDWQPIPAAAPQSLVARGAPGVAATDAQVLEAVAAVLGDSGGTEFVSSTSTDNGNGTSTLVITVSGSVTATTSDNGDGTSTLQIAS